MLSKVTHSLGDSEPSIDFSLSLTEDIYISDAEVSPSPRDGKHTLKRSKMVTKTLSELITNLDNCSFVKNLPVPSFLHHHGMVGRL